MFNTFKKAIYLAFGLMIAVAVIAVFKVQKPAAAPGQPVKAVANKSFNKRANSLIDPTSIWIIVNKQHPLTPSSFVPGDLREPKVSLRLPGKPEMQLRTAAAAAIEQLFAAAQADKINLQITTAYRGYNYQKSLYAGYVANQGQQQADMLSARPGFSEHQTGLAADIRPQNGACYLEECFGNTPEGLWLAANAYKYGFIIRYAQDKTVITGYNYEPWHIRYVGVNLANELRTSGMQSLEEFFMFSGGVNYIKQ